MKLKLPATELKQALIGLGKVVDTRGSLPILQTVRIDCAESCTRLSVTNLDQQLVYTCASAEVENPGLVILDFRKLRDLVRKPGKDDVIVGTREDGRVSLALDGPLGFREQIADPLDPAEWPILAKPVKTEATEPGFLACLQRMLSFASTDDTREVLNTVAVEIQGRACTMVATDGRRLTACEDLSLPVKEGFILPVTKFLGWTRLKGECRLGVSKTQCRIECGPWDYQSILTDGPYPNWKQVVPETAGCSEFTVHEEDVPVLVDALRTLPASEPNRETIALVSHNQRIQLAAHDENLGWAVRDLVRSPVSGRVAVSVSRVFLRQAIDAGFRRFWSRDELSPLVSRDEGGSLHVLMPFRGGVPDFPEKTEELGSQSTQEPPKKPKENPVIDKPKPEPDQLMLAFQTVKERVRELNTALSELGTQLKTARKQEKAAVTELNNARGVLAKLQSIEI